MKRFKRKMSRFPKTKHKIRNTIFIKHKYRISAEASFNVDWNGSS